MIHQRQLGEARVLGGPGHLRDVLIEAGDVDAELE